MKKTKIICTIGPASNSLDKVSKLIHAGMDVMRLNFSHGSHEEHAKCIKMSREASRIINKPIAIMLDTKGPEIRTMGLNNHESVLLRENSTFIITTNQNVIGDEHRVAVTYRNLIKDLMIGDHILIDDGLIELVVENSVDDQLYCRVLNSGVLGEYKGVNLPNITTNLPVLSTKDSNDLIFGCEQQVDFIAASFIRKATDIEEIRQFLNNHGGNHISIIAKIENQEGLDNFDDILDSADGIMVARGDLGVEIPIEEVILAQKIMVNKCNDKAKPVIIATQMLESMTTNPRPTRAEAGDVANAILDGADAVMLSGETAKGSYPIEAVAIMNQICQRTDLQIDVTVKNHYNSVSIIDAIHYSATILAKTLAATVIAVMTDSGIEARIIRQYYPQAQILAITRYDWIYRQLLLVKGVYPYLIESPLTTDDFVQTCHELVSRQDLVKKNEAMIIINQDKQCNYYSCSVMLNS